MRRLTATAVIAAAAIGLACASAGAPPGGPERHVPPEILSVSPESGQTNAKIKSVEFKFDEVVSDRPSGPGGGLEALFLVSPRDGSPNVGWHRNRITVRPRKGFRANTAYRVTMLPGLADLRGNVRKTGMTIVFATGPTFPPFDLVGRVFDWDAGRPTNGAFIEATYLKDTTLVYVTASDSVGQFDVGPLSAGRYRVRAIMDANNNRALDRNEKWDTTTVEVQSTSIAGIELDAIERDTLPPAMTNLSAIDSLNLRVTFDKPLDPAMTISPALFRLQRQDSSVMQIAAAQRASEFDKAKAAADSARAKATADSIQAAAAARDTTRRPTPPPTPARPPAAAATPGGTREAPPPPKPKAPAPDRTVVLTVSPANPLLPGRYVLSAHDVRSLVGISAPLRRGFTIAPPDTTHKAPTDTTRRPATPPGRPPR